MKTFQCANCYKIFVMSDSNPTKETYDGTFRICCDICSPPPDKEIWFIDYDEYMIKEAYKAWQK